MNLNPYEPNDWQSSNASFRKITILLVFLESKTVKIWTKIMVRSVSSCKINKADITYLKSKYSWYYKSTTTK